MVKKAWFTVFLTCVGEGGAFVSRDVVGLVAFDFILRIVGRGVMRVAFVEKVLGMDGDDLPRHPTGLGIPAYVIPDLEFFHHFVSKGWEYGYFFSANPQASGGDLHLETTCHPIP